jgi:hypothetical protein
MMRLLNVFLGVMLLVAAGSAAPASPSAISPERRLPGKDMVQLSDDLKILETVARDWSPEWRYELPREEAVSLAERALKKIDGLMSANEAPAGELLLLKGLTAHYAYNLDMKEYFEVAVESLQKAREALPADCRPLWYLGNHYSKAADAEKGMPLLKQAVNQCGDSLPLSFWEDYAYASVLAAMPATGYYALDQVKSRNAGVLTERVKAVEEGVKSRLVASDPRKEYEPRDTWHFGEADGNVRFVNWMYGFMIDIPGEWRVSPFGVRNGRSGISIILPKKGTWPPPLHVAVFSSPAPPDTVPEEVLRAFLAKAGPKRRFHSSAGPGVAACEKFLWLESGQEKGSRIVAGILRRRQPAYPGLLLESPHNIPKPDDDPQAPHYYTPVKQLTRLPGNLDYLIMVEGAPAAFSKGRADLEILLRNLVTE